MNGIVAYVLLGWKLEGSAFQFIQDHLHETDEHWADVYPTTVDMPIRYIDDHKTGKYVYIGRVLIELKEPMCVSLLMPVILEEELSDEFQTVLYTQFRELYGQYFGPFCCEHNISVQPKFHLFLNNEG